MRPTPVSSLRRSLTKPRTCSGTYLETLKNRIELDFIIGVFGLPVYQPHWDWPWGAWLLFAFLLAPPPIVIACILYQRAMDGQADDDGGSRKLQATYSQRQARREFGRAVDLIERDEYETKARELDKPSTNPAHNYGRKERRLDGTMRLCYLARTAVCLSLPGLPWMPSILVLWACTPLVSTPPLHPTDPRIPVAYLRSQLLLHRRNIRLAVLSLVLLNPGPNLKGLELLGVYELRQDWLYVYRDYGVEMEVYFIVVCVCMWLLICLLVAMLVCIGEPFGCLPTRLTKDGFATPSCWHIHLQRLSPRCVGFGVVLSVMLPEGWLMMLPALPALFDKRNQPAEAASELPAKSGRSAAQSHASNATSVASSSVVSFEKAPHWISVARDLNAPMSRRYPRPARVLGTARRWLSVFGLGCCCPKTAVGCAAISLSVSFFAAVAIAGSIILIMLHYRSKDGPIVRLSDRQVEAWPPHWESDDLVKFAGLTAMASVLCLVRSCFIGCIVHHTNRATALAELYSETAGKYEDGIDDDGRYLLTVGDATSERYSERRDEEKGERSDASDKMVMDMTVAHPTQSVGGVFEFICASKSQSDQRELIDKLKRPDGWKAAIIEEIETSLDPVKGDPRFDAAQAEEWLDNLHYVAHEVAGTSYKAFHNGWLRDTLPDGRPRDDRKGKRLADFVQDERAQKAGLTEGHVLALRLYSTSCYAMFNMPLRDTEKASRKDKRLKLSKDHPLPLTVSILCDGLKKLRIGSGLAPRLNAQSSISANLSAGVSCREGPGGASLELGGGGRRRSSLLGTAPSTARTPGGKASVGEEVELGEVGETAAADAGSSAVNTGVGQSLGAVEGLPQQRSTLGGAPQSCRSRFSMQSVEPLAQPLADQLRRSDSHGISGKEPRKAVRILWRGLRGLKPNADFFDKGGCELGAMSTTEDLGIAIRYALDGVVGTHATPHTALLLRFNVDDFSKDGADIQWLSAFPHEREFLYPPLVTGLEDQILTSSFPPSLSLATCPHFSRSLLLTPPFSSPPPAQLDTADEAAAARPGARRQHHLPDYQHCARLP